MLESIYEDVGVRFSCKVYGKIGDSEKNTGK